MSPRDHLVPKRRFKEFSDAPAWEHCKLSDITEYESSKYTSQGLSHLSEGGVYPIYEANGIITTLNVFDQAEPYISIIKDGAGVGRVEIRPAKSSIIGTMGYILPQNADLYFIYGIMQKKEFNKHITGSTIPHLYYKDYGNDKHFIPSMDEQKKVGVFLLSLEMLITLHERKLDKLKELKQSYLVEMFPAEGEQAPKLRFAGFTDDWQKRKLGEIATEIKRNDPNSVAPIMMITANYGFIEQSERYSFNNAGKSLKKYILLKKGELAYNHGASKLRPFGSCFALTTSEEARIPFVYHCFDVGENISKFISIELNGLRIEKQLRQIVSSGARMDGLLNISFEEYSEVEIMLPRIQEQVAISAYFDTLDHLITLHQRKFEKLQNLKKAYLHEMFPRTES